MNPVRALLVNENIGGHATVHHHLAAIAARRTDIAVRIVDVPPPGFWRKAAGVAIPGLAAIDADLRPARYQLAQSAWVARLLPRWLVEYRPDVVHLYTHNTGLLAHRALRRVPYVVTIDSTNAQSNLMHPRREPTRFSATSTVLTRRLECAVYTGAHRVVANSRWCATSLIEQYGVAADRVEVLAMGVPIPEPVNRPSPGPVVGSPRVLFVGRTLHRKGGSQLLRVHQRWLADRCELVLVTGESTGGGHNVTVIDDVRPGDGQIGGLLAEAALLVLPSRIDQWPNAVMEAMSYGAVPVVSNVGGLPEMVAYGRAGVVLADHSDEVLRDTIASLLDDPARRDTLARAAIEHAATELNVERTATRLFDLLRNTAGQQ